jgi:2-phosphosulfolactate phosphatase
MPTLDVYFLAQEAPRAALADATVIVVDLLRASTTICTALAAGAECVMPFAEIDETLAAAEQFGRDRVLLGGERGGLLIPGFDLGNSPAEYTPHVVTGRRILFSTTNGARAVHHAWPAPRVLVGAAVNRQAVAHAASVASAVTILCAGTNGEVTYEDVLAGGAIAEAIREHASGWTLTDNATNAINFWQPIVKTGKASGSIANAFALVCESTQGGRNLHAIGMDLDILRCTQLDTLTVVPELNAATGELRPA